MQRTSLNSGRRNCMETACLSVDAFSGHVRFGCRHKADGVELGQEPPPPPHPGPRQVAARHGPGFCCRRSAGGVEAGCPAAGPEAEHGLTCPERSLSSRRARAGSGRRAPRGRGGQAGARPVGGRLWAPGSGLRAGGRRAPRPARGRAGGGEHGGGVPGRGRAARRQSMAARPASPAPRGPARRLRRRLRSNRFSGRDVGAAPRQAPTLPAPRSRAAGPSLRPPRLQAPCRSRPRSVVIVTSQRVGPGWKRPLHRDVTSRTGGSRRRGAAEGGESGAGAAAARGCGARGGRAGGCAGPLRSAVDRCTSHQVSTGASTLRRVPEDLALRPLGLGAGRGAASAGMSPFLCTSAPDGCCGPAELLRHSPVLVERKAIEFSGSFALLAAHLVDSATLSLSVVWGCVGRIRPFWKTCKYQG